MYDDEPCQKKGCTRSGPRVGIAALVQAHLCPAHRLAVTRWLNEQDAFHHVETMRLQWTARLTCASGGAVWHASDKEAVELVAGQRDLAGRVLGWLDTLDEPTAA